MHSRIKDFLILIQREMEQAEPGAVIVVEFPADRKQLIPDMPCWWLLQACVSGRNTSRPDAVSGRQPIQRVSRGPAKPEQQPRQWPRYNGLSKDAAVDHKPASQPAHQPASAPTPMPLVHAQQWRPHSPSSFPAEASRKPDSLLGTNSQALKLSRAYIQTLILTVLTIASTL